MRLRLSYTSTGHMASVYALAKGIRPGTILSAGSDGWIAEWAISDPENGRLVAVTDGKLVSLSGVDSTSALAAGDLDGKLHWFSQDDPGDVQKIMAHKKGVFDLLNFGETLLSCGGNGAVTRWHTGLRKPEESLRISPNTLRRMAISPNEKILAIAASDGCIHALNPKTFELVNRIEKAHEPSVFALAWTRCGRYLWSGGRDAQLKVWDVERQFQLSASIPAHLYTINDLVISPDGQFLATASRDKTIRIWNVDDRQLVQVLDLAKFGGHLNSVNTLIWMPETLVSAGDDRTLKFWRKPESSDAFR